MITSRNLILFLTRVSDLFLYFLAHTGGIFVKTLLIKKVKQLIQGKFVLMYYVTKKFPNNVFVLPIQNLVLRL